MKEYLKRYYIEIKLSDFIIIIKSWNILENSSQPRLWLSSVMKIQRAHYTMFTDHSHNSTKCTLHTQDQL